VAIRVLLGWVFKAFSMVPHLPASGLPIELANSVTFICGDRLMQVDAKIELMLIRVSEVPLECMDCQFD
jgi:hypothetical protein